MDNHDDAKAALRAELRDRRKRLKAENPDAAVHAAQAFAHLRLGPFRTAAIYHPWGAELDPFPLAAVLERQGVRIALPVTLARDTALIFRLMQEGGSMPPDAIGIPAPGPDAPEVQPDLVVCPLIGFDRRGWRLGQGGGFYDRTLQALRARGPVLAMGLAYAGQELAEVVTGPFDQRLDGVLTETGYLPAQPD